MNHGKTEIITAASAAFMAAGILLYYGGHPAWAFAAACGLLAINHYNKSRVESAEGGKIRLFLIRASVAAAILRLWGIFSYPPDFFGDEWNVPFAAYSKLHGKIGLFEYIDRHGSELPFLAEALFAAMFAIFGTKIEAFRLLPAVFFGINAAQVYYIGKMLRGKDAGAAALFIYTFSGWVFFGSKIIMTPVFPPFLEINFLFFFLLYADTGRRRWLSAAAAVFIAGFFTYSSWIIMVPFAAYAIFEYREKMGKKIFYASAAFYAAAVLCAAYIYLSHPNIINFIAGRSVVSGEGGLEAVLRNLVRVPAFFVNPLPLSNHMPDRIAPLGFAELVLLSGGVMAAAAGMRHRENRLLLAGLLCSFITLLVSSGAGNHLRHYMAMPFIVLLAGIFLADVAGKRGYPVYVAAVIAVFSVPVSLYYLDWNRQLGAEDTGRRIAGYINSHYRADEAFFMHQTMTYGDYGVFLRTKQSAAQPEREKVKKVLFMTYSPKRYGAFDALPGVKAEYFYTYSGVKKFPLVLYELDVSRDAQLRDFMLDSAARLDSIAVSLWRLDYGDAAQKSRAAVRPPEGDGKVRLMNTFYVANLAQALSRLGRNEEAFEAMKQGEGVMYPSAEWYMFMSGEAARKRDAEAALGYLRRAAEALPEWDVPRNILAGYEERLTNKR